MKTTEIKERFGQPIKQLIDAIESDEINAEVDAFWSVMSRFHTYSMKNQFLIAVQRSNATRVAGYKTWQKMNRRVRKGEKGISILAPMRYTKKNSEYDDDDPRSSGIAFKSVSVFDVSQTDGDNLPSLTTVEGSEHGAVLDRMIQYATDNAISVKWCNTGAAKGSANPTRKLIKLSDQIDKNEAVGVLAHELAHMMIDQKGKALAICEYEAELSAYLFCDRFGIEIKAPHYLKSWGAERADLETALKAVSGFTGNLISEVAA